MPVLKAEKIYFARFQRRRKRRKRNPVPAVDEGGMHTAPHKEYSGGFAPGEAVFNFLE